MALELLCVPLASDRPWDSEPNNTYYCRVSAMPEDQTDGVFRGARLIRSIDEGIGGIDTIDAAAGNDVVIGGAAGDAVHGNAGDDVIAGDSARLNFNPLVGLDGATSLPRLGGEAPADGGVDDLEGDEGADIPMGGAAGDTIDGGSEIVFDRCSDTDFKFAAVDVGTQQVLIGHRTAAGWTVDAAVGKVLSAGADVKLGVNIRGSTVSVTLDGQAAVGCVCNAGADAGHGRRLGAPQRTLQARAATAAKAGGWQDRFVNHLGAATERVNPNASLRLHLPTAAGAATSLRSL